MAAYAGTVTVVWSVPFGNKRISLLSVRITNYNQTGIPLIPRQAGLGNIEFVTGSVSKFDDSNAPVAYVYDPTYEVCRLFKAPNTPVDTDVNLYSTIGDISLFVVGT